MFIEDARMERDCLRQGDILEGIPVPLLEKIGSLVGSANIRPAQSYLAPPAVELFPTTHKMDPNCFTALTVKMRFSYCAVLSNCCSLNINSKGDLIPHSFSLARLIPLQKAAEDRDKADIIRANADPRVARHNLQYFYLTPNDRLENLEWVVDCSQIMSLSKSEFRETLKRKILQMDDRWRAKFKMRVSFYLTRPTDEEIRDGLVDPWNDAIELPQTKPTKEDFFGWIKRKLLVGGPRD